MDQVLKYKNYNYKTLRRKHMGKSPYLGFGNVTVKYKQHKTNR